MTTGATRATTKQSRRSQPTQRASTGSRPVRHTSVPTSKATAKSTPPTNPGAGQNNEPKCKQVVLTRVEAIRELADRANQGSVQALANLRTVLDDCPEIWEQVGD